MFKPTHWALLTRRRPSARATAWITTRTAHMHAQTHTKHLQAARATHVRATHSETQRTGRALRVTRKNKQTYTDTHLCWDTTQRAADASSSLNKNVLKWDLFHKHHVEYYCIPTTLYLNFPETQLLLICLIIEVHYWPCCFSTDYWCIIYTDICTHHPAMLALGLT